MTPPSPTPSDLVTPPPPGPHDRFYPPDVPRTIPVPAGSVWQLLAEAAEHHGQGLAMEFLGRTWSWQDLRDEATLLAGALEELGVAAGDRVLLFSQNCPQFVVAFHAVLRLDAVVVPANPMYTAQEVAHYLSDAGCRVAIAASDIARHLAEGADRTPDGLEHLVVFDIADALPETVDPRRWPESWREWLTNRPDRPPMARGHRHEWRDLVGRGRRPTRVVSAGADDTAVLAYTSGTTGAAKGCIQRHGSLAHQGLAVGPWIDMHPADVSLIVVPMFHTTGLAMAMIGAVANASAMVLLPRWDRDVAARVIQERRVTHWPNIPTMVMDLLAAPDLAEYDLSSLRYVGGGGTAMPEAVATRLRDEFGLEYLEGYGLTESCAAAVQNPRGHARRGRIGIPFVGAEVRVVDTETLREAAIGQVGELVVRGPQVSAGYWNLPDVAAHAFLDLDGRRFFRTGDLGSVDSDGYFQMTDRLKRMINASGFKVWPAEVESILHGHPAVQEACVVAAHHPYRGETVKAFIVRRAGNDDLTEGDVVAWAKEHMAAYKYPREVDFVASLPHSATGKVMWRVVQEEQDAAEGGHSSGRRLIGP